MPDDFTQFLQKDSQRQAIEQGASKLGIDPVDYATSMSYETGGTFDPWQKGPVTKWGQHRGTIQYGEPQQAQYGVHQHQSFEDQVTDSNVRYLKDHGVRPGMGFPEVYAAINGGSVKKPLNTPDADTKRTIADNIRLADQGHRAKVLQRFWGGQAPADEFSKFNAKTSPPDEFTQFQQSAPDDFTQFLSKQPSPIAQQPAPPVPEPPATLAAQLQSVTDATSPKAAILTTEPNGHALIGNSPAVGTLIPVPQPNGGMLWINKGKAAKLGIHTPEQADAYIRVNGRAGLMGKVDDVGDDTGPGQTAVATKAPDGTELSSSIVKSPESAHAQVAVDSQAYPGSTSEVMDSSKVILDRMRQIEPVPTTTNELPTQTPQPQIPLVMLKDGRQVQVLQDHGTKAIVQEIKKDGTKGSITIQPKRKFQVNVSVDQMQPLNPDGTATNPTSVVTTDGQAPVADVSPTHFVVTGKNGEGAKAINDDTLQQTNLTFPIDLTNVQGEKTDYALTAVKNALMQKYNITAEQANKIVGDINEPINHDQNHVTMHVSRGDIAKVIGIDKVSDEYKNERAATNIANKPELDLHVGRDFTKDDAESLRQTLGDRAGTGVAALLAIGGKTSTMLAGAVRLLAAGRHDDTGIGDFLKEAGESTQGLLNASGKKELTYDKDGRPVLSDDLTSIIEKKGIEIVGDLARLYAMSAALPGASSLAGKAAEGGTLFGTQSALDTAGSGAPGSEVAKQTLKGIGVGATFGVAGAAGEGLTDVIGTLANKAVPKMFTEGLTLGTIAGSTAVIGKIAGDPNDVILTDAAVNSLFSVAPHVLGKVVEWTGSKLKARVSDDGQVTVAPADAKADVVIQKDGNAVEIDKQGTLDKIDKLYKSGKLSDAEAGSLSKEVDSGDADAAAGAVKAIEAKTANAPQESAKEEPQSKPDVQPAAKEVNPLVDDKGQPKVLYRGSSPRGEVYIGEEGGIFFSDSPEVADRYIAGKDNGKVYSATLDIKNPKVIEGDTSKYTHDYRDEIAKAKEEGHDGLVIKNTRDLLGDIQDQYVAFSPDQVKRRPAPQIEAKDNKLSADAAAEDKAKAIDNGTTTIAPNEILKTATELVNQHENELRSSSPDVVSGATEGDKSAESGAGVTPSSDNAPTLAKSVSESTKAAVDAAEAGKAASTAGEPAGSRESGRTVDRDAEYQAARDRIREAVTKRNVFGSGVPHLDTQTLKDIGTVANYHIDNGVKKFGELVDKVAEEFGVLADKIRPHLEEMYPAMAKREAESIKLPAKPPTREFTPAPKGEPSSIMHAEINADRENRGWDKLSKRIKQGNPELHKEVQDIIAKDPQAPLKTFEKFKEYPKEVPNAAQGVLLNAHLIDKKAEYSNVARRVSDAIDGDDPVKLANVKMDLKVADSKLKDAQEVAFRGGSERGAALQSQKMFADEDFEFTKLVQDFKIAKGREPSDVEIKRLQEIADEHKAKSDELETVLASKEKELSDVKAQMPPRHILDVAENYVKKLHDLADKERERLRTKGNIFQSGIDPRDLKSAAIIGADHLANMSLDFAKWSDKMVDEFGDKIKPHLDKIFEEAQKVLKGGHAALKSDADKMSSTLKAQKTRMATRIKELETAINKQERINRVRKSITPDAELEKLQERAKSLKEDYDAIFPKEPRQPMTDAQRLKALEKRLEKKQQTISDKIKNEDFSDTPKREPLNPQEIRFDTSGKSTAEDRATAQRIVQAQAEIGKVEKRYARMKDQAERQSEPITKWAQRKAVNYVRGGMLSAVTVFEKLGASSFLRPITGAIKTAIGYPISKIIPEINRMAKIEGSKGLINDLRTQAYALGKGFTTGIMDMGRTLKNTVDINDAFGPRERYMTKGKFLPFEVSQQVGLMHDALKAPAFRYAYESALGNLILDAKLKDQPIDNETMWLLGQQAYQYAGRIKFQEKNPVNNWINKTMSDLDNGRLTKVQAIDQVLGTMAHITLPINSISTNVIGQSLLESSPIGLTRGIVRAGSIGAARVKAKLSGNEYKLEDHLTPEQADILVRNLKSGSLGTFMYGVGLFAGGAAIGSFYQKYDKDKNKNVAKFNTVQIDGYRIPAALLHIPEFNNMFMGSTTKRIYEEHRNEAHRNAGEGTKEAALRGVGGGVAGMVAEVPGVEAAQNLIDIYHAIVGGDREVMGESRYGVGNFIAGRSVPGIVRNVAEAGDQDPQGHYVTPFTKEPFSRKVDTKTFGSSIKGQIHKNIPGLRNKLPRASTGR